MLVSLLEISPYEYILTNPTNQNAHQPAVIKLNKEGTSIAVGVYTIKRVAVLIIDIASLIFFHIKKSAKNDRASTANTKKAVIR